MVRPYTRWVALALLVFIAACYGVWTTKRQNEIIERTTRITQIVEGTEGPEGEPGIGVKTVSVEYLLAGSEPSVVLRNQHMILKLPRGQDGATGPTGKPGRSATISQAQVNAALAAYCKTNNCRGPQGPQGPKGSKGNKGEQGVGSPTANIVVAVNNFMQTHTFICTRSGRVFVCVVGSIVVDHEPGLTAPERRISTGQ